jgi:hypothetical protein
MRRKRPSDETLVLLRRKLEELPPRSEERRHLIVDCAGHRQFERRPGWRKPEWSNISPG